MQDNVSVIVSAILTVIIIVVFPIYNVATRQDSITKNMVVKATTNFVDEVRKKGYITEERYQDYITELNSTNNMYEVEMEVHMPKLLETTKNSGEYEEQYKIDYTKTILETIENSKNIFNLTSDNKNIIKQGVYVLEAGDQFYVRVRNTNTTQSQILLSMVLGGVSKDRIVVNYGGQVFASEIESSDLAMSNAANVFISRPMDLDGNEYKFDNVASGTNPFTGQIIEYYGIAVRLDDKVESKRGIKFNVIYKNVGFYDNNDVLVTDLNTIANLIINKIKCYQFKSNDISVKVTGNIGNYNVEIKLENIELDTLVADSAYIEIEPGIAYSISKKDNVVSVLGQVGTIKSKEFILTYKIENMEIVHTISFYDANNVVINGSGSVEYANIEIELNKNNRSVLRIEYTNSENTVEQFSNSIGTSIKDSYNNKTNKYNFKVYENGKYTVYACDEKGKCAVDVIDIRGVGSDYLKFVLSWKGDVVKDIDSYMSIIDNNGNDVGTVWFNKKIYSKNNTMVTLDTDVQTGNTNVCETLKIEKAGDPNYTFRYWIQDWSNKEKKSSKALSNAGIILKIYRGQNEEKLIFDSSNENQGLTKGTTGTRWNVLEYNNTTRDVKIVNTLVNIGDGFVEKKEDINNVE